MKRALRLILENTHYGREGSDPFRHRVLFPITPAERTISWFYYGFKQWLPPQLPNCRCSTVVITPKSDLIESTEVKEEKVG